MISTRRISSVLAVAAAFSCLGASAAQAVADSPLGPPINPVSELDALATTGIPEESKAQFPGIAGQLGGLSQVHQVNQLHQLTDLAAPATGLLPEIS
ncbi:hypothetical protein PV371_18670 [Streptomyces sp. TX20-6-3]|uniref:hypothetical protein n=1 Tax=Streptomyces sp. TX20-6-3 TaxID=3028705 RepID=UPI0029B0B079|nr:hypothetical protein [Streptomyces sp. TX20-6-3]MDX2561671.1 hypothetical protein [Streptomyces sp. TX20-6-3]